MKSRTLLALLDSLSWFAFLQHSCLKGRRYHQNPCLPAYFSSVQSILVFVSSGRVITKSNTFPKKTDESIQPCLTPVVILKVSAYFCYSVIFIEHCAFS